LNSERMTENIVSEVSLLLEMADVDNVVSTVTFVLPSKLGSKNDRHEF
jgi:hypothetical protein